MRFSASIDVHDDVSDSPLAAWPLPPTFPLSIAFASWSNAYSIFIGLFPADDCHEAIEVSLFLLQSALSVVMLFLQEGHSVGGLFLLELDAASSIVGLHELLPDASELRVES
jgi:hypothetical protein